MFLFFWWGRWGGGHSVRGSKQPVMNFEQEFILDLELGRGTFKQRVDVGETLQLPNGGLGAYFYIDTLRWFGAILEVF